MAERRDHYWRRAKQEGYRSRAAFKLLQIDSKFRIFRKGDCVLDLGCAPGGWLQFISETVGPKGRVVGVDLQHTAPLPCGNVSLIQGDLRKPEVKTRILHALGGPADVVTSDLSPKLTGIAFRDHLQSCGLVRDALDVVGTVLRPKGAFLAKIFQGEELESIVADLRSQFGQIRRIAPAASRKASSEIYLLARDFRGPGE